MVHPASAPKLSIITATLNPGPQLRHCLQSVAAQTWQDYEHIIIDGGSTDGTIELLHQSKSSKLHWLSERDNGIAEAMNKGIGLAQGQWYLFLQGDDKIAARTRLSEAMQRLPEGVTLISFDAEIINESGKNKIWRSKPARYWRKMPGSHQGMLFHKSIFDAGYRYNTSYQIAMDYDLVFRLIRDGYAIKAVHIPLAIANGTGLSGQKTQFGFRRRFTEEQKIHFSNSTSKLQALRYHLYWLLYKPYRRIISYYHQL